MPMIGGSIYPLDPDRRCFIYCGDEACICEAATHRIVGEVSHTFAQRLAEMKRDAAASRRITDSGGIDCTVRRSDRIGP